MIPISALSCFSRAEYILKESSKKHSTPDVDSEFSMQTKLLVKQTNDKRIADYKNLISEGRQMLAYDNPDSGLNAFPGC